MDPQPPYGDRRPAPPHPPARWDPWSAAFAALAVAAGVGALAAACWGVALVLLAPEGGGVDFRSVWAGLALVAFVALTAVLAEAARARRRRGGGRSQR
ncbi:MULTISPECIES: hypothetical protein [unclassified Curtobacterium]|jgi:hypothetical protein|uniref:hypothetical protein n=1 Tax=unclassified Curtobacterium TaxID=257496 RepID=UPI00052AD8B1|nr:hypothetical protein [Curtobacterium sp. MR_MD2014]AIV40004.1 hypothetical protein NI26_06945 [Curtobacterium sp. MR_MD2014]